MAAMTTTPLAAETITQLEAKGVDAVIGTVVNPAGLIQAKTVPIRRANMLTEPSMGASPVWHAFAIDQRGIALTDHIRVVGDQRIRIDLSALRIIGDGFAWAPGAFFEQDGTPVLACSRGTLGRVGAALATDEIEAVIGHEIEFFLVQFEISLAPQTPVAAADQLVLTRIIGRVARRYGMRVSLSPTPFADNVGSGAHQHFSLTSTEGPLLSGGTGARGMTPAGESAVAGVLQGLPDAQGILCGSIVSGLRIRPGNWAGAYACWGTDNREAALRFVSGGPASLYGENVEVKVVDPSANPYLASAAILGLARDGIKRKTMLPPETMVDPATLSDADRARGGIVRLFIAAAPLID
jgi:glutamine synthetase